MFQTVKKLISQTSFSKQALSVLCPYSVPTSCKKIRKIQWTVSKISEQRHTDEPLTDRLGDYWSPFLSELKGPEILIQPSIAPLIMNMVDD